MKSLMPSGTHLIILIVMVAAATATTVLSFYSARIPESTEWHVGFFLNFGTGLYGAAITFLLVDLILREKEKREEVKNRQIAVTSDLHNNFQETDMLKCRIKADKLFQEFLWQQPPPGTKEIYHNLTELNDRLEDWICLSRLLHFWEHVSKLDKKNLLDQSLFRLSLLPYLNGLFEYPNFDKFLESSLDTNWGPVVKELASKYEVVE